jgi:hypothetical protein
MLILSRELFVGIEVARRGFVGTGPLGERRESEKKHHGGNEAHDDVTHGGTLLRWLPEISLYDSARQREMVAILPLFGRRNSAEV